MKRNNYDLLNHIWNRQKLFNSNFVNYEDESLKVRQEMTKEYALHLTSEITSLLEEINWKIHHKDNLISVNRTSLVLEWIDIFKYWLSIGLLWDIEPEEFYQVFDEKSDLVEQRYLQEFSDYSDREIIICDIDGVLSDYPKTFINFVNEKEKELTGKDIMINPEEISDLDLYKTLSAECLIPTSRIKKYKEEYRSEGLIRHEGVLSGAKEMIDSFKSKGYYVVLLTSRPFDKYKNLYLDTYVWLKSNGFKFDAIISDSKKRDKINKIAETSTIKAVIDDDPKIISGLIGLDSVSKIYMIDRSYNKSFNANDKVKRVFDYKEITKEIG